MFTNEEMDFLRQLQKQMRYEEEHDNDCQASPRFWTIMDYRKVPTHEDYGVEFYEYIYNDGDVVEFDDKFELIDFLEEYFEGKIPEVIQNDLNDCRNDDKTFDDVWDMVQLYFNTDSFFECVPMKLEEYIVQDKVFLTKKDAKDYLAKYGYNHTGKAHTYAMTGFRSNSFEKLFNILMKADLT